MRLRRGSYTTKELLRTVKKEDRIVARAFFKERLRGKILLPIVNLLSKALGKINDRIR